MKNPSPVGAYQPVVILGAGRSGTNLLRDGLTRLAGIATWPCDEINYLWRSGAKRYPTDELTPAMAGPATRRRVGEAFDWVARRYGARLVVEKTCANTLRVPFVNAVVPRAKFIYLGRNGYDVTASAMKRWTAPLEPQYLARKARFVPLADLPYYANRYLGGQARRLFTGERALRTWGPRFAGLDRLRASQPLAVVCATQWRRCSEAAESALDGLPADRQRRLTYEQLVADPVGCMTSIAKFLGVDADAAAIEAFRLSVRSGSVGAGLRALSAEEAELVRPIVEANRPSQRSAA